MPKLIWTEGAKEDFREIRRTIAAKGSPKAATRVGRRIRELVVHLKTHPEMGKAGLWPGTLELVITDTPYIVVYVAEEDGVVLLGVAHGRQDRAP